MFKFKEINTDIERRILTGMIVSQKFLSEIANTVDFDYFENRWCKLVARWCMNYFTQYNKAPWNHINDIFNSHKKQLKDSEVELIEDLLANAAVEVQNRDKFNVDYTVEQALQHFEKRSMQIAKENIETYLSENNLKGARTEFENFRHTIKKLNNVVNPFDKPFARHVLLQQDESFFKLPGALGEFLGEFKRGWLVGLAGPFKYGKSWFAQEFAIMGMLQGLKVIFFSLEMGREEMVERILKRLIPGAMGGSDFHYPAFDCVRNQTGECEFKQRKNKVSLIDEEDNKMNYHEASDLGYKICTHCRGHRKYQEHFEPAVWHEEIKVKEPSTRSIMQTIESFDSKYSKRFKLQIYPKLTANISDIKRDLDTLEVTEGFVPDMIVIDHADCLKAERADLTGIEKEDHTWQTAAQLAAQRRALTILPTQVNKEALSAAMTTQKHTARWVGKLGHVDAMLAMSQTDIEKRQGLIRISFMLHRHKNFDENASVTILQKLDSGQFHLDSESHKNGIQIFS